MSDPSHDTYEPIREQHTIMVPAPRNDLWGILRDNTGTLTWIALLFAGFAGLVIAWERKANRTEVQALQKRVLKLETDVAILRTTVQHLRERRRKP